MKNLLLYFIATISVSAYSAGTDFNDLANTKGIKDMYDKCQTMGYIWNEIKPVNSLPKVIGFEGGRTSLGDLCYAVTQMKDYTSKLQNLGSKLQNEDITSDGFKEKMAMAVYNYNQAASSMDDSEIKTPSAIVANKSKKRYDSFYRRITGISTSELAVNPELQQNKEDSMGSLYSMAKLNGRRAALAEKLQCKDGRNQDMKSKFEEELLPLEEKIMELDDKKTFYANELKTLGSRFNNERKISTFRSEFLYIDKHAISIIPHDKTIKVEDVQVYRNSEGEKKYRPTKTDIPVQSFSTFEDTAKITQFEAKWSVSWKENVNDYTDMVIGSYDKGSGCSNSLGRSAKTKNNLDRTKNYIDSYNSRCASLGGKNMNAKTAGALFSKYFVKYIESYRELKKVEALAMTKESEMLREPLLTTKESDKINISKVEPQCGSELSAAEMEKVSYMIQEMDTEYRGITAEAKFKQNKMKVDRNEKAEAEEKVLDKQIEINTRIRAEQKRDLRKVPKSTSF